MILNPFTAPVYTRLINIDSSFVSRILDKVLFIDRDSWSQLSLIFLNNIYEETQQEEENKNNFDINLILNLLLQLNSVKNSRGSINGNHKYIEKNIEYVINNYLYTVNLLDKKVYDKLKNINVQIENGSYKNVQKNKNHNINLQNIKKLYYEVNKNNLIKLEKIKSLNNEDIVNEIAKNVVYRDKTINRKQFLNLINIGNFKNITNRQRNINLILLLDAANISRKVIERNLLYIENFQNKIDKENMVRSFSTNILKKISESTENTAEEELLYIIKNYKKALVDNIEVLKNVHEENNIKRLTKSRSTEVENYRQLYELKRFKKDSLIESLNRKFIVNEEKKNYEKVINNNYFLKGINELKNIYYLNELYIKKKQLFSLSLKEEKLKNLIIRKNVSKEEKINKLEINNEIQNLREELKKETLLNIKRNNYIYEANLLNNKVYNKLKGINVQIENGSYKNVQKNKNHNINLQDIKKLYYKVNKNNLIKLQKIQSLHNEDIVNEIAKNVVYTDTTINRKQFLNFGDIVDFKIKTNRQRNRNFIFLLSTINGSKFVSLLDTININKSILLLDAVNISKKVIERNLLYIENFQNKIDKENMFRSFSTNVLKKISESTENTAEEELLYIIKNYKKTLVDNIEVLKNVHEENNIKRLTKSRSTEVENYRQLYELKRFKKDSLIESLNRKFIVNEEKKNYENVENYKEVENYEKVINNNYFLKGINELKNIYYLNELYIKKKQLFSLSLKEEKLKNLIIRKNVSKEEKINKLEINNEIQNLREELKKETLLNIKRNNYIYEANLLNNKVYNKLKGINVQIENYSYENIEKSKNHHINKNSLIESEEIQSLYNKNIFNEVFEDALYKNKTIKKNQFLKFIDIEKFEDKINTRKNKSLISLLDAVNISKKVIERNLLYIEKFQNKIDKENMFGNFSTNVLKKISESTEKMVEEELLYIIKNYKKALGDNIEVLKNVKSSSIAIENYEQIYNLKRFKENSLIKSVTKSVNEKFFIDAERQNYERVTKNNYFLKEINVLKNIYSLNELYLKKKKLLSLSLREESFKNLIQKSNVLLKADKYEDKTAKDSIKKINSRENTNNLYDLNTDLKYKRNITINENKEQINKSVNNETKINEKEIYKVITETVESLVDKKLNEVKENKLNEEEIDNLSKKVMAKIEKNLSYEKRRRGLM